jgi:hypothetical protein
LPRKLLGVSETLHDLPAKREGFCKKIGQLIAKDSGFDCKRLGSRFSAQLANRANAAAGVILNPVMFINE